jgi:hypothetical protein
MSEFADESRWICRDGVTAAELDGETALLDENSGMYFGLDAVGSLIWSFLARGASVKEMVLAVVDQFEVRAETAASDLKAFLEVLLDRGLIRSVH